MGNPGNRNPGHRLIIIERKELGRTLLLGNALELFDVGIVVGIEINTSDTEQMSKAIEKF